MGLIRPCFFLQDLYLLCVYIYIIIITQGIEPTLIRRKYDIATLPVSDWQLIS